MWIFQTTQELGRGTSNILVANNIYWTVAFKIHVFDASLFEEKRQTEAILRFGSYIYHEYTML